MLDLKYVSFLWGNNVTKEYNTSLAMKMYYFTWYVFKNIISFDILWPLRSYNLNINWCGIYITSLYKRTFKSHVHILFR